MAALSNFERGDAFEDEGRFDEAFAEFLAGAEAGDVSCMTRLANMCSNGAGVPCCDYEKSIEWETKASEAGDPTALFNLGVTYRLKGDILKSKACFERALSEGDNSAAFELAKLYLISDKETETVKSYLARVIADESLSEGEREDAELLLSKL